MDVIGHEDVGVHRNPEFIRSFFRATPKKSVICLRMEDLLAVVAPMDYMGGVAGNELTRSACHMQQTCRPASGLRRNSYLTRIFSSYLTPILGGLLLAACSVVDPNNMIGRQMGEATPLPTEFVSSPPPATLRAEDRRRAFDFVWRTINDRYYNEKLNGVDWNT